jgi:hypothetical protein
MLLVQSGDSGSEVSLTELGDNFNFKDLPPDFMTRALSDRTKILKAIRMISND